MSREDGQALAVVLGVLLILSLLVAGVLLWSGAINKGLLIDRQHLAGGSAAESAVNYGVWWAVYQDPGFNLLNTAFNTVTPVAPAVNGLTPNLKLQLVNPPVTATISPSLATDCRGAAIIFNAVAQDAWGHYVYTANLDPDWSVTPSGGADISASGEFTGGQPGTYTVELTGFTAAGTIVNLNTPAQAQVQVVTCP